MPLVPARITEWFRQKGWRMQPFQEQCMQAFLEGKSGLLNAPTGSGKTLAMWLPCLADYMLHADDKNRLNSLQVLWITPLKALSRDLQQSLQQSAEELEVPWRVALRTGDTPTSERQKQLKKSPECIVSTPESMHLIFSTRNHAGFFKNLKAIIVDEWHDLIGSKRGVQMELVVAHLLSINPALQVWGISATIGNLQQASEVLLYPLKQYQPGHSTELVRSGIRKRIQINSILPDEVDKFPWAGHLGIRLIHKILPIVEASRSTLLFTNTRAQTEIWYQQLLLEVPELAGIIAMHHGALDQEIRAWVENALHEGRLKLVVCTSSLDLGVDFRPVETVIQVGSPKGAGRFIQRAGRSGHRPDALSRIYFLPTHALELIESAALRQAVEEEKIEGRPPVENALDVLLQYVVSCAVADGFEAEALFKEVCSTYAYRLLSPAQWNWLLRFITTGGEGLSEYDEFKKVEMEGDPVRYVVKSRKTAMRHRLSIGTIVSDPVIKVKYVGGAFIGTVEESFIARLSEGDVFWFAGRSLEFVRLKDMEAQVRKSTRKTGQLPRWGGGTLLLSSEMADLIRGKLSGWQHSPETELSTIKPILELQSRWSAVPAANELLVEYFESKEGFHLLVYPFEGRRLHETLSALLAWRIARLSPLSLSVAMNDYGFELLSDQPIPLEEALESDLFSLEHLHQDVFQSVNQTEMARRKFREIAAIAGLVFQGYPGKYQSNKHLQASSGLLFDVLRQYDEGNLLVEQAYREVVDMQLDFPRLEAALHRIRKQKIILRYPQRATPFAFPIMVDRLREQISSESLEDRIARMTIQLEKFVD